MTVQFHPDSWDTSAQQIATDAHAFVRKAEQTLGAMTTSALHCDGYGTLMDDAFSLIVPPSIEAFQETAAGLGRGFDNIGLAMNAVAASYRTAENNAEAEAQEAGH